MTAELDWQSLAYVETEFNEQYTQMQRHMDMATALESFHRRCINDSSLSKEVKLESFKLMMASVGVEGEFSSEGYSTENAISDLLAKLWKAIKDGLAKLLSWFKQLWNQYLSKAAFLVRKADDIHYKAANLSKSFVNPKIKLHQLLWIHIDKDPPKANQMLDAIKVYDNALTALTNKVVTENLNNTIAIYKGVFKSGVAFDLDYHLGRIEHCNPRYSVYLEYADLCTEGVDANTTKLIIPDKHKVTMSPVKLPAHKRLYFVSYIDSDDHDSTTHSTHVAVRSANRLFTESQYTKAYVDYGPNKPSVVKTDAVDALRLAREDIMSISHSLHDVLKAVVSTDHNRIACERQWTEFMKCADTYIRNPHMNEKDATEDDVRIQMIALLAQASRDTMMNYIKSVQSICSNALATGHAILEYCDVSLN